MMISEVARRYAKALYETAMAQSSVEKVLAELRVLKDLFSADAEIVDFVSSPVIAPELKVQALQKALDGKISKEVMSTLTVMATRNRLNFFHQTALAFEEISDTSHGVTRGEVKSAAPLSGEARKQIEQTVTKVTGKKVILNFTEDAKLLGGMLAQVGGWTFDDSLASHLQRMNEELNRRSN